MIRPGDTTLSRTAARYGAVALLALALVLAWATGPGASEASARPMWTGITNLGSNEPIAFNMAKASGAKFVRIPLNWQNTAPTAPPASWQPDNPADPNYDWHNDADVINAIAAGMTPVLQIDEAPVWAQRCQTPNVLAYAICDPDPAALAAFATAAARRYSGAFAGLPKVQYWQALNEPNLSLFFFPQYDTSGKGLSPGLYRKLLNGFYDAVKAVDPTNLVLAAGLGPIAVPQWTMGPMRFARELLCMKGHNNPKPAKGNCEGGVRADIFAIQPYTTGGPTHVGGINDVQLGGLGKLKNLLKAADKAKRIKSKFKHTPLWITEFSWDTQPPDPGGLPMAIASRWTAEAVYHAWRVGISHFFWFSLHDDEPSGRPFSQSLESGLYFRGATMEGDQPKEVRQAFRFPFVAYPRKGGLYVWGRTPTSGAGKVRIEVWAGNDWRKVLTATADKSGVFNGIAKTGYGRGKQGLARAVYAGESSLSFSMKPVPDFKHPPFG
ncbi:MAG TPA: hypothetical protein VFS48_04600 [Solirubrobacterales bacterium]|nr:hypothetical protein [Solirubrobacterales bacterium]